MAIAAVQPGNRALTASGLTAAQTDAVERALGLLAGRRSVVLTGAGVSTDSGIPDYRGPGSPSRRPMTIAEFRSGPASRQRYWARSHIGWARIRDAQPNGGHHALAALQAAGALGTVITQNVDGLHRAAGSAPVVDLHGRLDTVVCLECSRRTARSKLQRRLAELNPGFGAQQQATSAVDAPDGDAVLTDTSSFVVADCLRCGGVLKPDVVFFGENVPADRVRRSYRAVDDAGAMLVAGSSLAVMSGLRFVKYAATQGLPVVIVNRGATRGDGLAAVTIDAGCTPVLQELSHAWG